MIRVLRVARRGAMKARIQAGAPLDAVITSAPESVRGPLRKLTSRQRIRACAAFRVGTPDDPADPIPVSSGRTERHRLHRGGDRDANSALWRIALVRMHCHQKTKDCVVRSDRRGKTVARPAIC